MHCFDSDPHRRRWVLRLLDLTLASGKSTVIDCRLVALQEFVLGNHR
jgi:hypothetical protein